MTVSPRAPEAEQVDNESEDACEASEEEAEADEESDSDAADGEHYYERQCKYGVLGFLEEAKGMSAAEARAFVRDHIDIRVKSCTMDDVSDVRSVEVTASFGNEVPHDGAEKRVGFKATLSYHSRTRWSSLEHFATLKYEANGPDAATTVSGSILSSQEHPGCELANRDLPLEHEVSFIEARKYRLSQKGARALQAVCGPGWTAREALVLLYASVGVAYADGRLSCDGLAEPILKSDWLEYYTRQVCTAATTVGDDSGSDDDDYETDDSGAELQKAVDWVRESLAEEREDEGEEDEDDGGDPFAGMTRDGMRHAMVMLQAVMGGRPARF